MSFPSKKFLIAYQLIDNDRKILQGQLKKLLKLANMKVGSNEVQELVQMIRLWLKRIEMHLVVCGNEIPSVNQIKIGVNVEDLEELNEGVDTLKHLQLEVIRLQFAQEQLNAYIQVLECEVNFKNTVDQVTESYATKNPEFFKSV